LARVAPWQVLPYDETARLRHRVEPFPLPMASGHRQSHFKVGRRHRVILRISRHQRQMVWCGDATQSARFG
jgi:hypothetical protein